MTTDQKIFKGPIDIEMKAKKMYVSLNGLLYGISISTKLYLWHVHLKLLLKAPKNFIHKKFLASMQKSKLKFGKLSSLFIKQTASQHKHC